MYKSEILEINKTDSRRGTAKIYGKARRFHKTNRTVTRSHTRLWRFCAGIAGYTRKVAGYTRKVAG